MKPIVFASNPSFWFETLRSFSHTAPQTSFAGAQPWNRRPAALRQLPIQRSMIEFI
jgi:hypothetical protein